MNKLIKRMKQNNKGFTLVEIIVVLVILAILAAAMIPTMLGYVTEARGKSHADSARVVYNAAQTIATELSALGQNNDEIQAILNDAIDGTMGSTSDTTYKTMGSRLLNLVGQDIVTALNAAGGGFSIKMSPASGGIPGSVDTVFYQTGSKTEDYMVTLIAGKTTTVEKMSKAIIVVDPVIVPVPVPNTVFGGTTTPGS